MKRFYQSVSVEPGTDGWHVLLDGRPVRTPARAALAVPLRRLADAIADEWHIQGETIDPRSMAMTGLANAAIDRVAPDRSAFARDLARYAETDLLCYRASEPPELAARQAAEWDPVLDWARARYDIGFVLAEGILHKPQPPATVARLSQAVAVHSDFALAALSPLTTISGSLVMALALSEGEIEANAAFDTAHLDELWQAEIWGEDQLASDARAVHRRDFVAAAGFLGLLAD